MTVLAKWNGVVLAKSENCEQIEGNYYFPPDSIERKYFKECSKTTFCGWKGTANYYDVVVEGQINEAAAWYYAEPMEKALNVKDYVAFWNGVIVEKDS